VFQALIAQVKAQAKAKAALAAKSAACGLVAMVTGLVALAFFIAAGVVWLADRLGTIEACLIVGGAFVVIAIAAILALVIIRRRAPPPPNLKAALAHDFVDPQALALGAEIMRLMGGRRAASIGLIGAFAIGLLLSRTVPKK
jgi:putative superfamily III holin-X